MNLNNRNFNVISIVNQRPIMSLTSKQYLIYSYLLGHSEWNGKKREQHYYVYKNKLPAKKEICKYLKISRPTFYNAIEILKRQGYVEEQEKYYKIKWCNPFAPIEISTLKKLTQFGSVIKHGGLITEIIGALYYYKRYMDIQKRPADMTISNLCKYFFGNQKHEEEMDIMCLFLKIYYTTGMIITHNEKRVKFGHEYKVFVIDKINLCMNKEFLENDEIDDYSYQNLIEALDNRNELIAVDNDTQKREKYYKVFISGDYICRLDIKTGEVEKAFSKEQMPEFYEFIKQREELEKLVE